MARKKKAKINPAVFKYMALCLFVLALMGLSGFGIYKFINTSDFFKIKTVRLDSSLSFVDINKLSRIKGKNIFFVDLKRIQRDLSFRYPQISQLKVIRRFPDQLFFIAKKRMPFFQLQNNKEIITLDDQGVVVSKISKRSKGIPFVEGLNIKSKNISLGKTLRSRVISSILNLIRRFKENENLSSYSISTIQVAGLSKLSVYLSNDFKIIMDYDNIKSKVEALGLFLSSKRLDPEKIKYIDLRYNDIVVKEH